MEASISELIRFPWACQLTTLCAQPSQDRVVIHGFTLFTWAFTYTTSHASIARKYFYYYFIFFFIFSSLYCMASHGHSAKQLHFSIPKAYLRVLKCFTYFIFIIFSSLHCKVSQGHLYRQLHMSLYLEHRFFIIYFFSSRCCKVFHEHSSKQLLYSQIIFFKFLECWRAKITPLFLLVTIVRGLKVTESPKLCCHQNRNSGIVQWEY